MVPTPAIVVVPWIWPVTRLSVRPRRVVGENFARQTVAVGGFPSLVVADVDVMQRTALRCRYSLGYMFVG